MIDNAEETRLFVAVHIRIPTSHETVSNRVLVLQSLLSL